MKGRQGVSRRLSLQSIYLVRPAASNEDELARVNESASSSRRASRSHSDRPLPIAAKSNYKVVVLGSARVGKTSLVSQFVNGTFSDRYRPTVDEMHSMELDCNGVHIRLEILDTGGAYQFPAMRNLAITGADGFILVCAADDPSSLEAVEAARAQVMEARDLQTPIVVVFNKIDLTRNEASDNDFLCLEMVESLVTCDWGHGFVAVSAKLNQNVIKVFQELLNQAKSRIALSPAIRKRRTSLPGRSVIANAISSPGRAQPLVSPSASVNQGNQNVHKGPVKRNSCSMS